MSSHTSPSALSLSTLGAQSAGLRPPWRIGVDIGGTFTDLVVVDRDGRLHAAKVPSTPARPSEGVLNALNLAADQLELSCNSLLGGCSHFVHGSTVATNIVLERRGNPVGMLVTRGFRDSLHIRRGIRTNAWDHRTPFPPPLVPRHLRLPITGRIDRHGVEIEALSEEDVHAAIATFKDEGIRAVAVCLYNSFINEAHEQRTAEILRAAFPEAPVSLSSKIAPIVGEYERGSTAVLNAYVGPQIVEYVSLLAASLRERGFNAAFYLVQNNGGVLTLEGVQDRPAALLLSGPAAAVGALRVYGRNLPGSGLLSMEIGGTSCDVILTRNGEAELTNEFELGGYHVALPSIDIHSVGAGGGTIAGVDRSGMLFVGPRGAGADPGPACYGRGGREPTITDAQLVLGRLSSVAFGGSRTLDTDLAHTVIATRIAEPLGISVTEAAAGMLQLLDQQLVHAVQKLSAQRGHDPRRFTLVAAGGAGPMHGASVGRKLGSLAVYVPRLAGTFCALGMLNIPVRHEFTRACLASFDAGAATLLEPLFSILKDQARAQLEADGFASEAHTILHELDLRHPGQVGALRVPLRTGNAFDFERVRADFLDQYARVYGHRDETARIEVVRVRVVGVGSLPSLQLSNRQAGANGQPITRKRDVYFEDARKWWQTNIYKGEDLRPGMTIFGPAILEELTTSVIVGPQDVCAVDQFCNFVIDVSHGGSA